MKELRNFMSKSSQCYGSMWLKYWYIGLFVVFMVAPGYSQGNAPNVVPNAYIFLVQDDIDPDVAATSMAQMFRGQVRQVYNTGARGFAIHNLPPGLEKKDLEQFAWIKTVSPDLILETNAQEVPTGISRIGAAPDGDDEALDFGGEDGVNVAIIDTGIDVDHEDLNVVGGYRTFGKGPAKKWSSDFDDDSGHGTHVAGTVAALDNDLGVVGVAPGANLYAVKVLDQNGRGYISDIIAGVEWVTANAATIDVANMSLGGGGVNEAFHDAIKACVNAGVVIVVSAGNARRDIYGPDGEFGTNDDVIPAAYPETMTISALTDTDGLSGGNGGGSTYAGNDYNSDSYDDGLDDSFTFFSNFSHAIHDTEEEPYPVVSPGKAIDLILPGVDINSTYLNDSYRTMSGTSMSSPHAAGLVARYIAEKEITSSGSEKVYEIRQALIDNAVAQRNAAQGLTYLNDPDGYEEPIGWAGAPVESNLIPTADFSYTINDDEETEGIEVYFIDESSYDSGISTRSWDFGDGSRSSTEEDPTHTYEEEGSYEVTLTVKDDQGDSSSITKTVVVSTGSLTLHVGDIDGGFQNWGKENRYSVWVTVHDKFENIISGATVSGRWVYAGETIEAEAISDSEGIAFMDIFVRKKNGNMITFVVDDIDHDDYDEYERDSNHDEDGDSDGTEILINF